MARTVVKSARHAAVVAACAAAARVIFGLLKVLVKRRFRISAFADEVVNLNPLKWAAYFASWALYPALKALLRFALPNSVPNVAGELCAGALVAQSVRVFESSTQTELALYLLVRALHGRTIAHVWPLLPDSLANFQHYDVITMFLTGSQILYAIICAPLSHSPNYMGFLQSCTMLSRQTCEAIGAFHRSHMTPGLVAAFESNPAPPVNTDVMPRLCEIVHLDGKDSCNVNMVKWMAKHMLRFSLPMYIPLKISTTVLFNSKGLVKRPLTTLTDIVVSGLRSSLFLTVYCAGPLRSICFTSQNSIRGGWKLGLIAGMTCALATFLEPKSRRLDLALYCCVHALRSVVLMLYHRGYLPRPRRWWTTAMHTAAVALLLQQYDARPETLNKKLVSGMGYIVTLRR